MRSEARSLTSADLPLPNAAHSNPITPLFEGSRAVSRSVKRLEMPQDCKGAWNLNNKVAMAYALSTSATTSSTHALKLVTTQGWRCSSDAFVPTIATQGEA